MNHTILITGASSGIGKDTARALAKKGHTVYAAARRLHLLEDLQDVGCIPIELDVSKEAQAIAAVERIEEEQGGIEILINNAGIGLYGSMEETSLDDARYQLEVNLFGLARLTQLVLPHLRENGSGRIINISSVGGRTYTPFASWYHASKHALEGWSDSLRVELKPFSIDVIVIQPGAVKTEFCDAMSGPILERSGKGPYKEMATHFAATLQREMVDKGGSDPDVITRLIIKAVETRRPKTRYAAGKYAKLLLWLRRTISDRMYDRIVTTMIRP
ncbi:MAG: oxidoreductase [Verrucomicrobiota bacterium]